MRAGLQAFWTRLGGKKASAAFVPPPLFSSEMVALSRALNADAVAVVYDSLRIRLDYSVESVAVVEQMLGRLHDDYVKTRNDEGLNGLALMFAAYIVQVTEQNFSAGVWERDNKAFGKASFPYHWEGTTLFPFAWCGKRIFDGSEDNVQAKFKTLVVDRWLKKLS